jgi:renalase
LRVGIVGAGISGLSCADALVAQGHDVMLFDKARGPGGRMSTRRADTRHGEASFDHGAQYFTVRDPGFTAQVSRWEKGDIAARWAVAGQDAWVGTPAMNSPVKAMAAHHNVRFDHLVQAVTRIANQWHVMTDTDDFGPFDTLIIAIPAEQAAALLALSDFEFAEIALKSRTQPCWTAMMAFGSRWAFPDDIIRNRGILSWAARNSAKPDRKGPETWVIQATPAWSAAHLEQDHDLVIDLLSQALAESVGLALPPRLYESAHRWRYALSAGTGDGALWNAKDRIGVCGDWLVGPRVECAWLSGQTLAARVTQPEMAAA